MVNLILTKKLFAKIDQALDELKWRTSWCRFEILYLRVVYCFFRILKETVFKDLLLNNLLFNSEISPAFIKKVSKTGKILENIRSWVFAKAIARIIEQDALDKEEVSWVGRILRKAIAN